MNKANLTTPVLFIIYNSPDLAFRVFEEIRRVRPSKLYIAADGPKNYNLADEEALCKQTRSVINMIDWDCALKTKFQYRHIGHKFNVSESINWFFENEAEGIILEEDCLPNNSFFYYCSLLLNTYRHDTSVGHIGGNVFIDDSIIPENYFFSKYPFVWGWATWRRAWKFFDYSMYTIPETLISNSFSRYFNSKFEQYTFYYRFLQVYGNKNDSWYYQWLYTLWYNNLKSIVPPINLVEHISFDARKTYTNRKEWHLNIPANTIREIHHPVNNRFIEWFDNLCYKKIYRVSDISNIYYKCKLKIYKVYYTWFTKKLSASKVLEINTELV